MGWGQTISLVYHEKQIGEYTMQHVATYIDYASDLKIVLTQGLIGDYAAYEGLASQNDLEVASRGNKRHDEDVMRKMFCLHIQDTDKYRH
jgi:hypothetical protein